MTSPACLACGESGFRRIRSYRTDSVGGRRLFGTAALFECERCGLVQMAPVPSRGSLAAYYAEDYRVGGRYGSEEANVQDFPRDNLFYLNRGESISELVSKHVDEPDRATPRILDIGAGFGHTLHSFAQRYPRSTRFATELSEVCIAHLNSLGVTVFRNAAEDLLPEIAQEFDIIVLSHVLEHLPDPRGMLSLLRRSISSDGILYVEVPNIPFVSLTRYPENRWAPRVDEPHITFFSPRTLRDLLERDGWTIQFCDTAGPEYDYVSWLRYRIPRLQPLVLSFLPKTLKSFLRRQRVTKPLRVRDREDSFYRYGGTHRLWIRCIARPPATSGK